MHLSLMCLGGMALLAVGGAPAFELPTPIDLSHASAFGDRPHGENAGEILDGDEGTFWTSHAHDLSAAPANVFITLPGRVEMGLMEVVIPAHPEPEKYPLRIANMDVYARSQGGWAKIGGVRDNDQQPRFFIELKPSRAQQLRLRIYPRSETVTQWAQIAQVRLYPPVEGADPLEPEPEPLDETGDERLWMLRAFRYAREMMAPGGPQLSRLPAQPVLFSTDLGYLGYVRRWFEIMGVHGVDRYGGMHSPMFAAMLDVESRTNPNHEVPLAYSNQRRGDRCMYGTNLQHDVMALLAARHVSEVTGDDSYRLLAQGYLQYFLDNCSDTPTGLWPWGEHACWDFHTDTAGGRDVHHLLCSPLEFWEWAYALNPGAVLRQCRGLINHIHDLDTFVFNRHADIRRVLPDPRPKALLTSTLDFANSASRFLRLWAFAYSKTGDDEYLDWMNRLLDHLEWSRIGASGPLPVLSNRSYRPLPDRPAWDNTMLVGVSLVEYAPLLEGTATGDRFRRLGIELLDLVATQELPSEDRPAVFHTGRGMGGGKTHWAHVYRMTGNPHFLEAARRMAEPYRELEAIPDDVPMRAQSYGVAINLMLDMYELEGHAIWLEAGERYGRWAIEALYADGLFRGMPGLWYQDSQMGTSTLVYALVRLHAAAEALDIHVPPNVYGF